MKPTECCLEITDECITCGACVVVCYVNAISESDDEGPYILDQSTCNCCVGHDSEPQCVAVCPVDVIESCSTTEN